MRKLFSYVALSVVLSSFIMQPISYQVVTKKAAEIQNPRVREDKRYLAATFRIIAGDSCGSGFAISPTLAVTCFHVIEQKDKSIKKSAILEFRDGRSVKANVVGYDQAMDLAILEMETPVVIYYKLAANEAEPGTMIAIIKSRPEYIGNFSSGQIKELIPMDEAYYGYLTKKVDFGNSGSPVVNANYEVVGVIMALVLGDKTGIYGPVGNIRKLLVKYNIRIPNLQP